MESNKTKRIYLRVTPSEYEEIKQRSSQFLGMSHYILSAVREFSNQNTRAKIAASTELATLYQEMNIHLAHIGGNLNQAMQQYNTVAKMGIANPTYLHNSVYPHIEAAYSLCKELQQSLMTITKKYSLI